MSFSSDSSCALCCGSNVSNNSSFQQLSNISKLLTDFSKALELTLSSWQWNLGSGPIPFCGTCTPAVDEIARIKPQLEGLQVELRKTRFFTNQLNVQRSNSDFFRPPPPSFPLSQSHEVGNSSFVHQSEPRHEHDYEDDYSDDRVGDLDVSHSSSYEELQTAQPHGHGFKPSSDSLTPSHFKSKHKSRSGIPTLQLKTIKCTQCDKTFAHLSSLRLHESSTHAGLKPYACTLCDGRFTQSGSLKMHMRSHTGEKPYSCSICDKRFPGKSDMKKHELSHDPQKRFSCHICGKRIRSKLSLRLHVLTHSADKPFKCLSAGCGKSFIRSSQLELHSHAVHSTGDEEGEFQCTVCPNKYATADRLQEHAVGHERKYACDSCTLTFTTPQILKKHQLVHSGVKPYQCDVCSRMFARKWDLKSHHRTVHLKEATVPRPGRKARARPAPARPPKASTSTSTEEKSFRCQICPLAFVTLARLTRHLVVHSEERPFNCELCGSLFRRKDDMWGHQRKVHNVEVDRRKEKPDRGPSATYTCEICSSVFLSSARLKRHLLVHSDARPFSCDVCGKSFRRSDDVKSHARVVHGKQKRKKQKQAGGSRSKKTSSQGTNGGLACEVCGRAFVSAYRLQRHLAVHSDTKPFECDECGKGFRRKDDVWAHQRQVHSDGSKRKKAKKAMSIPISQEGNSNSLACDVCGRVFVTAYRLQRHLAVHSDTRPFACDVCGKGFRRQDDVWSHQRQVHKTNGGPKTKKKKSKSTGRYTQDTDSEDSVSVSEEAVSVSMSGTEPEELDGDDEDDNDNQERTSGRGQRWRRAKERVVYKDEDAHEEDEGEGELLQDMDFLNTADIVKVEMEYDEDPVDEQRDHLHPCTVCPESFQLKSLLQEHLLSHCDQDLKIPIQMGQF